MSDPAPHEDLGHEETIFNAAVQLRDLAKRTIYLDLACENDPDLRARIEKLLANDAPESFFAQPLAKQRLLDPATPTSGTGPAEIPALSSFVVGSLIEQPGERIGRYKLREKIGEGGCGVVYMADQEEPVCRRVALKVIKLGMDTKQVVARFEAERQALALMDHPNIAKVLDAGATEHGRPYFVMELVGGMKITDYCEQHQLTTRQRLDIFIQVCHAIQHAHQKGVIHRDLKPSNVLVAEQDGVAVPKVIDFGIAKATQGKLVDQTVFTAFEQFLGTPAYMSPEQAQLGGLDVDTRSDIYSLGVLLYELLTGRTPFDTKELIAAGLDEIRRTIREVEPAKPSTRLTQERLAAGKSEVRNPKSEIDKDLDWIVMKALEKDRARRYESTTAFAEDIQRFLNDDPVVARPPSTAYRTLKFARKHRAAVLVAGVFIVGLVTATIVSTALALWAKREQGRAERATTQATQNERKALDAAKAAGESENEARTVLGFFKDKVLAAARPEDQHGGLGWNVTLRAALDSAEPSIAKVFTNQPLMEASIREALGDSYWFLGLNTNAIPQHERALALRKTKLGPDHPDTLRSMNHLANSYADIGRHPEALKLYEETLALRKTGLGPDHPDTIRSMNNLALCYTELGRHTEALKLHQETLALAKTTLGPDHPDTLMSMNNLTLSYSALGRHTEALELREETLALLKTKLGPDHPHTLRSMSNLADTYRALGRHTEALKLREETLALRKTKLGPDHPDTLRSMSEVAASYYALDRRAEAMRLFEQTLALRKTKLGLDHPDTFDSLTQLATAYFATKRFTDAETLLREFADAQRNGLPSGGTALAATLDLLGSCLLRQNKHAQSTEVLQECVEIYTNRIADDWRPFKARIRLGTALFGLQRFGEAETELLQGYQGLQQRQDKITARDPARYLHEALQRLVDLYAATGQMDQQKQWQTKLEEFDCTLTNKQARASTDSNP